MNQNYTNAGVNNPSYIPNQSTYPPYMNIPGYTNSSNNPTLPTDSPNSNNTTPHVDPQYAENLFSINQGKEVTVYFSYPDSLEWRDRSFTGTILASGRDYLLLKDNQGQTFLLWLVYINFAVFNTEISY